ncbi:uncharacterized protein LOC114119265 [Aphis gossypii]|uniref:uncharacterized protein LOC114119265 n=1 Tax=Aphis gossypii TaxID=80765 RepID=UPI002158F7AF|nr:uncharacterized protein LOC114119265 [Aphis gossypii]
MSVCSLLLYIIFDYTAQPVFHNRILRRRKKKTKFFSNPNRFSMIAKHNVNSSSNTIQSRDSNATVGVRYRQTTANVYKKYIKNDSNNLNIYKTEFLLSKKIFVEKLHPFKSPPLCHVCQTYGHIRKYCFYSSRCVKCGEEHLSASCNKQRTIWLDAFYVLASTPLTIKDARLTKKLDFPRTKHTLLVFIILRSPPKPPPLKIPDAQAKSYMRSCTEVVVNNKPTLDIVTNIITHNSVNTVYYKIKFCNRIINILPYLDTTKIIFSIVVTSMFL